MEIKKEFRKLCRTFLGLVLCCAMFFSATFALDAEAETAIEAQSCNFTETYINPLYRDVINVKVLTAYLSDETDGAARANDTLLAFSTLEESVEYLRTSMVNREEKIVFCISRELYAQVESALTLYDCAVAYEENCSGQEGDALAYGVGAFSVQTSISYSNVQLTYSVMYYTNAEQEQQLTEAVNAALRELNLGNSDEYIKTLAIHDYICNHVDYDYAVEGYTPYTAYAALCKGTAVCQGYAVLFYRMCKEAGLSVRVISGVGNGGPHAWNIVKIGSLYYNVDVTWDGQGTVTKQDFFLCGESDFGGHCRDSQFNTTQFRTRYPMGDYKYVYVPGSLPPTAPVGAAAAYGAVYDMDYYYHNNPDVAAVCGYDGTALFNHFLNCGMAEGRVASAEFNINIYKANYPDLVETFGDDNVSYYMHYINSGKAEGRVASGEYVPAATATPVPTAAPTAMPTATPLPTAAPTAVPTATPLPAVAPTAVPTATSLPTVAPTAAPTTTPTPTVTPAASPAPTQAPSGAAAAYAAVFDAEYYYNNNSDVAAVIGSNEDALLNHFLTCGMAEGRTASEEFSVSAYKANYPDLVAAFGDNNVDYYMHYINCGKAEGRTAAAGSSSNGSGSSGSVAATGYEAVFDADFYYDHNGDVAAALGHDANALFNHFVTCGMKEGRVASAEFDINVYKATYSDLVAAFGDNNENYYMHYINCGKAEGRVASGSAPSAPDTGVPEGDYSLVFDAAYYADSYSDLKGAFGYDEEKLLNHFLACGMAEGRVASANFNVYAYMANYEDLRNAFGNDLSKYYEHYMTCGYAEGRIGL